MNPSRGQNLVVALLSTLLLACCTLHFAAFADGAAPKRGVETPDVASAKPESRIVAGCVLSIAVDDEPEISHEYTVDRSGAVRFSISDSGGLHKQEWDVSLIGKSSSEAKAAVTASLATYFKSPAVKLAIVRFPGVHVEITGEVQRQGTYVLPHASRVSDLLGTALTKPLADISNILVRRGHAQGENALVPTTFNIDLTLAATDEDDDPMLEDGDKVFIRRKSETSAPVVLPVVRVVGEINYSAPNAAAGTGPNDSGIAIPLSAEMKLHDVIERAGGLRESADRAHLYLGRQDGTTRTLSVDRIEAGNPDQNLVARAGDLLIVPKRDRSQVFAVLGEVTSPNTFAFRAGAKMNLLQAIAGAGDLSKKADHHRGILSKGYLLDPTKSRQIAFDPDRVKKGEQPNMEVEPGDAVFIEPRKKRPTIWQQLLPLALHFLPF